MMVYAGSKLQKNFSHCQYYALNPCINAA